MNVKDFEQEVEYGIKSLNSLREGIARDELEVDVAIHLNLAGQYFGLLTNQAAPTKESFYFLTRAFHNLGMAQGKIDVYKANQLAKTKPPRQAND
jgi:hypothetical protein